MRGILVLLLVWGGSIFAQDLEVGPFRVTLGQRFELLSPAEAGSARILTPAAYPVAIVSLELSEHKTWESAVLDYLLSEAVTQGVIPAGSRPQEVRFKTEGAWTTVYWTYGGTKSFFGMYWGGATTEEGVLLFWADPFKASGRPQYQALSEVTKGVSVSRS